MLWVLYTPLRQSILALEHHRTGLVDDILA